MKKISIISPCHNEELLVDKFFNELFLTIDKLTKYDFDIIIINDGSTDKSLELLEKWSKKDSRISIIDLNRNFGKEIAITAGLDHVKSDGAIIIDFDLQHPIRLIKDFLQKAQTGFESVIGKRKNRNLDGFFKRKITKIFYKIYNIFSDVKIKSNTGDFRFLNRKIIDQIKLLPERQRFMKGLFAWVGAKSAYVEYEVEKRPSGKTKFSIWKLWNFAIEGITSFSTLPLRIWTYVGFFISLISFSYASFITIRAIIYEINVPGYSSIIVAILFLGGIQIMGIGIIGEYLGRVYMESKNRPTYLIRQIINNKK